MAEFTEVVRQKDRMCRSTYCNDCGIKELSPDDRCFDIIHQYPEQSQEIIINWAKSHPVITNRDKLKLIIKDAFGESVMECYSRSTGCRVFECHSDDCSSCTLKDFWDREYMGPFEVYSGIR